CEVLDESGNVLGRSITYCSLNLNKNTSVSTANAPQGTVSFRVNTVGNYRLRWTPVANANGDAGYWDEVVIGHIKISQNSGNRINRRNLDVDSEVTAITDIEEAPESEIIFDISGRKVTNPTKGIYIKNGKKIVIR
ncbi:MAG: hypothetical protein IKQ72_06515, partial [Bacteroidaceae bacterium]|nr:hypothetical protein [Bacteroidaceae bacterium]